MIKVVVYEPQKEPYVKEIENGLKPMQDLVGGYIEIFPWDGLDVVVNEEGKLQALTPNRVVASPDGTKVLDILVGTFFITKHDEEGDSISLNDEDIENAKNFFPIKA